MAFPKMPIANGDSGGILASLVRFSRRMYALDYIVFGLLLGSLFIANRFDPFHTMFSLSDTHIQHPFAEKERVPGWLLWTYAIYIPFGVVGVFLLVTRSSVHKIHVSLLGLGVALVLSELLTSLIKDAVGRPRPDLLSRCKPKEGTSTVGLVGVEVCTETNHHRLHDGWRSFPSGHSSFSMCGLGYLSLLLAGQLRALHAGANLLSCIACLVPIALAVSVAISRLEDYRHDPYDVSAGMALGFTVAYFSYRRYYPRLRSKVCNEPFVPSVENGRGDTETGLNAGEFEMAGDNDDSEDEQFEQRPLHASERQ